MQPLVHYGVACDHCGLGPIAGRRYKCGNCPNFDVCEQCYPQAVQQHHQSTHIFIVAHRVIKSNTGEALLPALVDGAVVVTKADWEQEFHRKLRGLGEVRAD